MGKFDRIKMAVDAVDQEKAINVCLLCSELKKQIASHHQQKKSLLAATKDIATCKQCQPLTTQIIMCAKQGHIKKEEPKNAKYP